MYDMPRIKCPHWITSDPVYLRFHGVGSEYSGRYGKDRLKPWVDEIRVWIDTGRTVYAYFNNDPQAHAIEDARTLIELLDK